MGKGGRPVRYNGKYKLKVLTELGVRLTKEDIKRIEECSSENDLDRIARTLIMRN